MSKTLKLYVSGIPVVHGEIITISLSDFKGRLIDVMNCIVTSTDDGDLMFERIATMQKYTLVELCKIKSDVHFIHFQKSEHSVKRYCSKC